MDQHVIIAYLHPPSPISRSSPWLCRRSGLVQKPLFLRSNPMEVNVLLLQAVLNLEVLGAGNHGESEGLWAFLDVFL